MAKEDTPDNHIHATHEKSYGHLHKKGGDHHVNASPARGATQGPGTDPKVDGKMM